MTAESERRIAAYRRDVRTVFRSMSDNALAFQNARIPWTDCVDRQEIDRELDRRAAASRADSTASGSDH